MRIVNTIILFTICICSFGQSIDSSNIDVSKLRKDRTRGIQVLVCALGAATFTSDINKTTQKSALYFNAFDIGLSFNKISFNGLVSLGGQQLVDTITYQDKKWNKGAKLRNLYFGLVLDYTIIEKKHFAFKAFGGLTTSFVDHPYKVGDSLVIQKSNTIIRPLIGVDVALKFRIRDISTNIAENKDIAWSQSHWALVVRSGVVPSVFKDNIGLKGNMFFTTIGFSFSVTNYLQRHNKTNL